MSCDCLPWWQPRDLYNATCARYHTSKSRPIGKLTRGLATANRSCISIHITNIFSPSVGDVRNSFHRVWSPLKIWTVLLPPIFDVAKKYWNKCNVVHLHSPPEMFCDAQHLRRSSKLLRWPVWKLSRLRAPTSGLSVTNIGALGSFSTMSLQPRFTTRACPGFFIGAKTERP